VSQRIFLRNSFEEDLVSLYNKLVELGMDYQAGKVYLADMEELEGNNIHA